MATSLLLHWHQNTPLCDPQSQKPQRASNQSDKTELSQSVCIQTQNRLPVCLSVCLSDWLSDCLSVYIPASLPFPCFSVFLFSFNPSFFFFLHLSFLSCLLTSLPPFIFPSFFPSHLIVLSFLCTVLPLFCLSFIFSLHPSCLAWLLFPPVLPFVCPSSPPSFLSSFHLSSLSQKSIYFFHTLSIIPSFLPVLLPFISLSLIPSILLSSYFSSFGPFLPSPTPPSSLSHPSILLRIMVWTQLCALHTLCSTWLQPHVLLLFGQRRDNQICVKCSLTLGSTLIGVSTQAGFQLPAQMWLCLLCRPFKSDWDLMNRWEQAHQIWAGSANPARVDWHTNQQRNRVRMCIFHLLSLQICLASLYFVPLSCNILYLLQSEQEKNVFFCFKETKTAHHM